VGWTDGVGDVVVYIGRGFAGTAAGWERARQDGVWRSQRQRRIEVGGSGLGLDKGFGLCCCSVMRKMACYGCFVSRVEVLLHSLPLRGLAAVADTPTFPPPPAAVRQLASPMHLPVHRLAASLLPLCVREKPSFL
jgi:hypothetical protein